MLRFPCFVPGDLHRRRVPRQYPTFNIGGHHHVAGALHHAGKVFLCLSRLLAQTDLLADVLHQQHDVFDPALPREGDQAIVVRARGQPRRAIHHLLTLGCYARLKDLANAQSKVHMVIDGGGKDILQRPANHPRFGHARFLQEVPIDRDDPHVRVDQQRRRRDAVQEHLVELLIAVAPVCAFRIRRGRVLNLGRLAFAHTIRP